MTLRQLIRIVALCALTLYAAEIFFGPKGGPPEDSMAPRLSLAGMGGEPLAIAPGDGTVQVLDFWATWCPPCAKSLPALQRLHAHYKHDRGVDVVGVNVNEGPDAQRLVEGFMASRHYSFPVGFDPVKAASVAYQIKTIPTLVVIDGRGRVQLVQVGLFASDPDRIFEHLRQGVEAARSTSR